MISGFMIARNLLKQGYPFVEAIASTLPICDEFLVSDGYSTDGTYEMLQKIAGVNRKVKVHQYKWPDKKDVNILSEVTNEVRSRCQSEYILSIQANEIIHERSVPFIKALPEMFPSVDTFSFPFMQFVDKYRFTEGYRLRFAKNHPGIVSKEDAWTLGASKEFSRSKILRSLTHPRRFVYYLDKGVEFAHANSCFHFKSRAVYLPDPVFRYWALFPKSLIEKAKGHKELFNLDIFRKSFNELNANIYNPEIFWKLSKKFLECYYESHYPEEFSVFEKRKHPTIIQEFISNPDTMEYCVRDELFDLIKKG